MSPALPRYIVRYIAVAITVLLAVTAITAHNSAVDTCRGQNTVRLILVTYFTGQVAQSTPALFRQFFPTVPAQTRRYIRAKSLHSLNVAINDLHPLGCGSRIL